MTDMTELELRVTIPEKEDVDDATAQLLDFVYRPHLGRAIPTVGVLALTPTMFGPFLQWASALALEGILPKRDQELLALRTAVHCHSEFEWVEHAGFAKDAGMTDAELEHIKVGPDAGWVEHEAALLRAADELHHDCEISRDHLGGARGALLPRRARRDPVRRRPVHDALDGRERPRHRHPQDLTRPFDVLASVKEPLVVCTDANTKRVSRRTRG